MRDLTALKLVIPAYRKIDHLTLVSNMSAANRDHFHLREGCKENMPFICLINADLLSKNKRIIGQIGGEDDDRNRKVGLLNIKFEVSVMPNGKLIIEINSSDGHTTYEESIRLVNYCLWSMSKSSAELLKRRSGGNGKNKKGYYPQSAKNTGRFSTFKKTFEKAVNEMILPSDFQDMFILANYNLVHYKG